MAKKKGPRYWKVKVRNPASMGGGTQIQTVRAPTKSAAIKAVRGFGATRG